VGTQLQSLAGDLDLDFLTISCSYLIRNLLKFKRSKFLNVLNQVDEFLDYFEQV